MSRTLEAAWRKAEREYERAAKRSAGILTKPDNDPIWSDQEFWDKRWPVIVDNAADAVEKASAAFLAFYDADPHRASDLGGLFAKDRMARRVFA